jgi:hypothetical protein
VDFAATVERIGQWYAARPTHTKVLLAVATTMLVVELLLRNLARGTRVYAAWTAFFLALGKVWTVVLLSVMYLVAIGPVGLVMRLLGRDLLDQRVRPAPSFWQAHEPNPLGPRAAARHQF